MEYVPLYTPGDFSESAFIESLLKAYKIRYIIQGEIATRVYPQLSLTQRTFLVHPDDMTLARKILAEKINPHILIDEKRLDPRIYFVVVLVIFLLIAFAVYTIIKEQAF